MEDKICKIIIRAIEIKFENKNVSYISIDNLEYEIDGGKVFLINKDKKKRKFLFNANENNGKYKIDKLGYINHFIDLGYKYKNGLIYKKTSYCSYI